MDQTDVEALIRNYLAQVAASGAVSQDAFAVLYGPHASGEAGDHEPICFVLVDALLGSNPLAEAVVLEAATWDVDTRLAPFPATPDQWASAEDSPVLSKAAAHGKTIRP